MYPVFQYIHIHVNKHISNNQYVDNQYVEFDHDIDLDHYQYVDDTITI